MIGFLPTTEVATALVNRTVTWSFGATILPGLELAAGVPQSLRTLVAVPTLLTSESDLLEQIEQLEVHHLAGATGDLSYVLLFDGVDADQEVLQSDAHLLGAAAAAIERLNRRYEPGPGGSRFLLLYRRRVFNPKEKKWMGWERKRGKLHELNRLLRGATDTTFISVGGCAPRVPADVRYVITLDVDTRLPRDAALRLVGKMAHPLNRPRFSGDERRIVGGYAVLQPRVTPSLPVGRAGSLYQRVTSGPGGMDPYAAAVSDVYQDLFGEGSYTGKGIYDVDAFEAALSGRVPDNTLLSHDLLEGIFARAGLASDIEVVEEFPSRYDVAAQRRHRWTRGDWQLLPWILGTRVGRHAVPWIGLGKMVDNLRRSLLAPLTLMALGVSWLLPTPTGMLGILLVLSTIAIPAFFPTLFSVLPRRAGISLRNHFGMLAADLRRAAMQSTFSVAFLADQAWRTGDAIVRTLVRLAVTRTHLLEWTTAAQSMRRPRLGLGAFYREMAPGTLLALVMAAGAVFFSPPNWPIVLPFALLWLLAPALAAWSSRSPAVSQRRALSENDVQAVRLIARRTWRFFETFVTPSDNMLPPDNFQEDPKPVIAHRTSPTNMGLFLLSAVAARDFGWAGTTETVERLEATFGAMLKLQRFKGHFFNWYGTQDLRPLDPGYISSVDSGNLAGHLIVVANACEEWGDSPEAPNARLGMADDLRLAQEALGDVSPAGNDFGWQIKSILGEIEAQLSGPQKIETLSPALTRLTDKAAKAARNIIPVGEEDRSPDLVYWIEALGAAVTEHGRDRIRNADDRKNLKDRLNGLAATAREIGALDGFCLSP